MFANEKNGVGSYSIYMFNLKLETLNISLLSMHCIKFQTRTIVDVYAKNTSYCYVRNMQIFNMFSSLFCCGHTKCIVYLIWRFWIMQWREKNNTQNYFVIFFFIFKELNLDPVNISFNEV